VGAASGRSCVQETVKNSLAIFSFPLSVLRARRLKLIPLSSSFFFSFSGRAFRDELACGEIVNRAFKQWRRGGDARHVACATHRADTPIRGYNVYDIYLRIFNLLYNGAGGEIIFPDNGAPLFQVRRNISPRLINARRARERRNPHPRAGARACSIHDQLLNRAHKSIYETLLLGITSQGEFIFRAL